MIFIEALVASLKLPTKKAMFKLNRIGMDVVVIYLFILLFITSIPALIDQLAVTEDLIGRLPVILKFIYFFMFYYLPLTVAVFIFISIVAYIGVLLSKMMKRKLRYQILWKLIGFTATLPFLIYMIVAFFYPISDRYLFFIIIYSIVMLVIMISKFPKRKGSRRRTKQ
ncbi:DUF1189 family protein [Oceanobacillus sp. CAU 1775]